MHQAAHIHRLCALSEAAQQRVALHCRGTGGKQAPVSLWSQDLVAETECAGYRQHRSHMRSVKARITALAAMRHVVLPHLVVMVHLIQPMACATHQHPAPLHAQPLSTKNTENHTVQAETCPRPSWKEPELEPPRTCCHALIIGGTCLLARPSALCPGRRRDEIIQPTRCCISVQG